MTVCTLTPAQDTKAVNVPYGPNVVRTILVPLTPWEQWAKDHVQDIHRSLVLEAGRPPADAAWSLDIWLSAGCLSGMDASSHLVLWLDGEGHGHARLRSTQIGLPGPTGGTLQLIEGLVKANPSADETWVRAKLPVIAIELEDIELPRFRLDHTLQAMAKVPIGSAKGMELNGPWTRAWLVGAVPSRKLVSNKRALVEFDNIIFGSGWNLKGSSIFEHHFLTEWLYTLQERLTETWWMRHPEQEGLISQEIIDSIDFGLIQDAFFHHRYDLGRKWIHHWLKSNHTESEWNNLLYSICGFSNDPSDVAFIIDNSTTRFNPTIQAECIFSAAGGTAPIPVLELLLSRGWDINQTDKDGNRVLDMSSTYAIDVVRWLLSHGANPKLKHPITGKSVIERVGFDLQAVSHDPAWFQQLPANVAVVERKNTEKEIAKMKQILNLLLSQ